MEELLAMLEKLVKEDNLFDLSAKILAKSMKALQANGFTHDEALRIVATHGSILGGSNK